MNLHHVCSFTPTAAPDRDEIEQPVVGSLEGTRAGEMRWAPAFGSPHRAARGSMPRGGTGPDAKLVYAEAAPGMVAGVLKVNCMVPLNSPSGYAVPITLSTGNTSSPAGVTLAVK